MWLAPKCVRDYCSHICAIIRTHYLTRFARASAEIGRRTIRTYDHKQTLVLVLVRSFLSFHRNSRQIDHQQVLLLTLRMPSISLKYRSTLQVIGICKSENVPYTTIFRSSLLSSTSRVIAGRHTHTRTHATWRRASSTLRGGGHPLPFAWQIMQIGIDDDDDDDKTVALFDAAADACASRPFAEDSIPFPPAARISLSCHRRRHAQKSISNVLYARARVCISMHMCICALFEQYPSPPF